MIQAQQDIDQLCINTIRTLAMDAVQQAHSGHPGAPMALAPVVYCLWQRFLRFDPDHPIWPNRDRFVLSAGHASMLLYAMLHLTGVKAVNPKYEVLGELSVSLDDIKRFRQLDSKCPGHPEYRWTSGVETTTGPLGQGRGHQRRHGHRRTVGGQLFQSPGLRHVRLRRLRPVRRRLHDGGHSSEAASLAGHLKLANLCWIYDNNHITIEGNTALTYSDDVATRFIGYGWNVTRVGDANDLEMLERAFTTFKHTHDRPTLIIVDTHIAYGAPHKQDTSAAHGEPLGEEEIRLTKRRYGWPEDAKFLVPDGVREHFQAGIGARGQALQAAWWAKFEEYRRQYPELAEHGYRMLRRELPDGWDRGLPTFPADAKGMATRDASSQVLNVLAKNVPWLLGGSADLGPSCKTRLTFDGAGDFSAENPAGRNLHFGIREHAMGAILNGLSLSKIRPFGSGFLIFSDYARTAIRLSALMEIPVIHIFTHDSIGVGEDGPTHQPVEQLASLRAIPGLITLRPADANEVVEAWRRDHAVPPRAGGPDPDPAGAADPGPHHIRLGRRRAARGIHPRGCRRRHTPRCCCWPRAARWRSASTPMNSSRPRASKPAWSACRRGRSSSTTVANIRSIASTCCRRRSPPACRWNRRRRSAGRAMLARPAAPSAWRPSGRRRRSRNCSGNSALPPRPSWRPPKRKSPKGGEGHFQGIGCPTVGDLHAIRS